MARIHTDDLPVAEALTSEQEALLAGAGLRSFRPCLESLEGRDLPSGLAPMTQIVPAIVTTQVLSTNLNQLGVNNVNQDVEKAHRPAPMPTVARAPFALQGQLQTAIGRGDLQQVGKLILDAAQREANALWPDAAAEGRLQLQQLVEPTTFDHGVRVTLWLIERTGARSSVHSLFDVDIKYDDKGAVTAESGVHQGGHRKDIPFVQNLSTAFGGRPLVPPPPPEGSDWGEL
jgi:hypothetical protein